MSTWLTKLRTTDWDNTLWVSVYPINGDGSETTQRYIERLDVSTFRSIEEFFIDESRAWELALQKPLQVNLAPQVPEPPPSPPTERSALQAILWSLQFRYWAWKNDTNQGPAPDIRMFLVYHSPRYNTPLEHSVGLEKGLIGIANVYAIPRQTEQNNVIIAHEILHTLGASDKYAQDNYPLYPDGFAEPDKQPLLPQTYAEIMGGRRPVDEATAVVPINLHSCLVGRKTAEEINWSVSSADSG